MPPKRSDIEERITKASQAMDADRHLKGTKAAARFGAPYQRLMARRKGRPASNTRGGHNKKLAEPEDEALKDYILMLQYTGHGANIQEVRSAANRVVYWTTGDEKETVSLRWTKRWMTRQAEFLKSIKEKPLSAKRLAAHIIEDVRGHFKEFERVMRKYNIAREDVSNFDESGFQIGVISGDKVYVSLDCEAIYAADPDNRELVTAVATINYGVKKVPAMIIFKGAHHLRGYFKNTLDGNILFRCSAIGFINRHLAFAYIQHFDRYYPPSKPGAYRVLVFNGHDSHLSRDFLDFY